jgi:xanthine dehydrogenase iron-sulfur cluster and FAD-binding subunit A
MKFPREMTRVLKEFGYFDPSKVEDAVSILGELKDRIVILAGGTDVLNLMKLRQVNPEFLLNIKNIKELEYLKHNGGLEIGEKKIPLPLRCSRVVWHASDQKYGNGRREHL